LIALLLSAVLLAGAATGCLSLPSHRLDEFLAGYSWRFASGIARVRFTSPR